MTTTGIQAPMVNFETTTTISTRPVVTAPTTLMTQPAPPARRLAAAGGSGTMPDWASVKPQNTPTA